MWKLRWKLRRGETVLSGSQGGLRGLRECRTKLAAVRREGTVLLEAYAYPEVSGGKIVLSLETKR